MMLTLKAREVFRKEHHRRFSRGVLSKAARLAEESRGQDHPDSVSNGVQETGHLQIHHKHEKAEVVL